MAKKNKFKAKSRSYYRLAAWHGARLMDEKKPGWFKEINRSLLQLNDGSVCILGQAYGGFWSGRQTLGLSDKVAESFGFVIDVPARFLDDDFETEQNKGYSMLTEAWLEEIAKRLRQ